MLEAFNADIYVPNISTMESVEVVLKVLFYILLFFSTFRIRRKPYTNYLATFRMTGHETFLLARTRISHDTDPDISVIQLLLETKYRREEVDYDD